RCRHHRLAPGFAAAQYRAVSVAL
ncbi:hypothetical protein D046_6348B, partial [Vibrio parahaemolyticus V-223/04]